MLLEQKILQRLNEIGIALSKERNIPILLEKILLNAKELTHSDGGTIYTVTPERKLHFEIVMSTSLNFHLGGTSGKPIHFDDLPLENESTVVGYAVIHKKVINVKDAYHEEGFDFSGTRLFDQHTGYRTQSVLTIPIKNHEDDVIAVLQLLNSIDKKTGEIIPFSSEDEQLAESLASQAGVALTNQLLITNLRNLFESLIRVIAAAIDEKSPSTGNHGKRVPIVALLLAQAVSKMEEGPFKEIAFSKEELYELEVAAFLHDCGKITTPVHVVEKRHKLETLFDRIDLINTRFEALHGKLEKELLMQKLHWFETNFPKEFSSAKETFSRFDTKFQEKSRQYSEDQEFIRRCNTNEISITEEAKERIHRIAEISYNRHQPLLNPDEIENLSVEKGNLTDKEREIIKQHVVMTYRMLSQLHYPKDLKEVPEIAASHHERVDGKGYPRGLKKEELSLQARILAIADIFEALSAPDRPYKKPLPLSEVFKIMQEMAENGHLDPDLFQVFLKKKVYLEYARQYLTPEQLDV